jgi:NAD(P)-dependent dehydrogenase (short-subunit alcohol dehydrogenase family)
LIDAVLDRFGRIDALVHTIGGFAGGKSIAETADETFQRMLAINLYPAFYLLRAAIPAMRPARKGRIIVIGSRSAVEPAPKAAAYGASKAALISLVKSAAEENKDAGITVNAVLPSTIDTPQNRAALPKADFSQWVSPESIAGTIVWLASDAAAEMSGAAIPVYGKG